MLSALRKSLSAAARSPEVRCIVITGAGRAFSAGQDLSAVSDREGEGGMSFKEHLEHTYNPIVERITQLEKPVIAAVNGVAAGAGASLALACDIRFAAASAKFVTAFARVGLVPDSGSTQFLPRMIGYPRAYEIYATGGSFSAEQAHAWGVVNHLTEDGQTLEHALELATKLAQAPTKALGLTKRAMRRAMDASLSDTLAYEAQLQQIAGETADHKEGVAAFLEKRPARFEGR
jgi:2-(1,2-epoxy-1,2-dihydrophenyl)acetyl-CoA isomerase